jgi:hypothetical protein
MLYTLSLLDFSPRITLLRDSQDRVATPHSSHPLSALLNPVIKALTTSTLEIWSRRVRGMRTTSSLPNLSKSFLPILGLLDDIFAAKQDDSVQSLCLRSGLCGHARGVYEGGTVVRSSCSLVLRSWLSTYCYLHERETV